MSEILPDFELLRPTGIEEAVKAFKKSSMPRYCAGGTDFLVNMRRGLLDAGTVIDLGNIEELKIVEANASGLYLGAGLTIKQLVAEPVLTENYPAIAQAALCVAGPTHREVATLGGNLCLDTRCKYYNQSHWWRKSNDYCLKYKGDICHVAPAGKRCRAAFSGDLAPSLLVHGAEIDIAGRSGKRRITMDDFYKEDGADHLILGEEEIVVGIKLPPTRKKSTYAKIRIRGAIDFPLAGVAVAYEKLSSSIHHFDIAVTGTNSCPILVKIPDFQSSQVQAEEFFSGLKKSVQKAVSPQRTTTTASHYRRLAVSGMAMRIAKQLWNA
jgi:4-hydroxybenzoyl-CoA reductase subunit beta